MSEQILKNIESAFNNVANDWDSMIDLFAEDAVIKYSFSGFPAIKGDRDTANAGFKTPLGKYSVKFNYLHGTKDHCLFAFSSYFETKGGKGVVYTGHGYLEFNEEGKITKKTNYSNNSDQLAEIVNEYMSSLE